MTDLSKTIEPKSDQLNADDLIGRTMTVKITKVSGMADPQQPIAINFEGDNGKPFKPCKSMRRVLVQVWGPNGAEYVGRSMTLYRDPAVKFGGIEVGGIRISHMSNIDKQITMALTESKAKRKPYVVKPLANAPAQTNSNGSAPAANSEEAETKKKAAAVNRAIQASPDADDLDVLWNVDYAQDIAFVKEKSDTAYNWLVAERDKKAATFAPPPNEPPSTTDEDGVPF